MTSYLIDTDWVIDFLKGKIEVIESIKSLLDEGISISVISLGELYETNNRIKEVINMPETLALKEISFENLLDVVLSLPLDKKRKLHDILDKDWQGEFDQSLASARTKMSKFTPKEIDADIDEALEEVRRERYANCSN